MSIKASKQENSVADFRLPKLRRTIAAMENLAPSFDDAWERFVALPLASGTPAESLRLLEDSLEVPWFEGRDTYLAFVAAIDDAAVQRHIERVIARICSVPGIEPYPPPYWHITLKGLGFQVASPHEQDELAERDIRRIAKSARPLLKREPPVAARIGLPNAFAEVVFLEVWDGGLLARLNSILLGVPGMPSFAVDVPLYLPHVTVARIAPGAHLAGIRDALAALRSEPPGPPFTLTRLDLVRARLSEAVPVLERQEAYELGRGQSR